LLNDCPWLKEVLPPGGSLEGFLWPANYQVLPDTTPEELVRDMLDGFHEAIGDRMTVPASRGLTFYQVLSLASIVEKEAAQDQDRSKVAGVFTNRLNPKLFPNLHLGSDPTVFYIYDTLQLANLDITQWRRGPSWPRLRKAGRLPAGFPTDLAASKPTTPQGLFPGPFSTRPMPSTTPVLNPAPRTRN